MKIKQCSLFSGIGAFEKAMSNLGVDFEITSYCEINKYSSCAYAAIHGVDESLNLGDISQVKSEDIPEFNLLTWGFPCQDISIAGKQAGIKRGTRSGLYYEGYRILKDRLPKYSIIENVKNLTQKGHKEEFAMILEDLEGLGYKNYWKVLNAKDFGVPQNRERVFIISILGDGDFEFPEGFDSGIRLKDVLEEDIDEKYYVSEKMLKGFLAHNKNHEGRTGFVWKPTDVNSNAKCLRANGALCPTDNTIIEPIRLGGLFDTEKSKHQAGAVWDKETIAPTLDTMQGGYRQPSIVEERLQHNITLDTLTDVFRIRKLTPLECWRLMGFSDEDFDKARKALIEKFYKGNDRANSQLYKMAGNSIVVDVLMLIFKQLFN